jgi:NitT/TauT family transport system substrate-binding protein
MTACGSDDASTTASGLTRVRFTEVIHSIFYAPQYIAEAEGFFEEAGIEVDSTTAQGTDKGAAALISGGADIALVGPEAAIQINSNPDGNTKVKVISRLTSLDGTFLVGHEEIGDFSWDDVRGKTIIGWKPGGTPEMILEAVLRSNGIEPGKDVEILTNLDFAARDAAFLRKDADFISEFEPNVTNLTNNGAHSLLSIGQEFGPHVETAYVATADYIEKNATSVAAWASSIEKAKQWIADTDDATVAKALAKYFPGVAEPDLVSAVASYKAINAWEPGAPMSEKEYASVVRLLSEGGVLAQGEASDFGATVVDDASLSGAS